MQATTTTTTTTVKSKRDSKVQKEKVTKVSKLLAKAINPKKETKKKMQPIKLYYNYQEQPQQPLRVPIMIEDLLGFDLPEEVAYFLRTNVSGKQFIEIQSDGGFEMSIPISTINTQDNTVVLNYNGYIRNWSLPGSKCCTHFKTCVSNNETNAEEVVPCPRCGCAGKSRQICIIPV